MALLQQWRETAYNEEANPKQLQAFWQRYFDLETGVYEQLLADPDTEVKGTVKEDDYICANKENTSNSIRMFVYFK